MKVVNFLMLLPISLLGIMPSKVQAQWVQTNGPGGGDIHALTASEAKIFAGTSSGVFRSTNNGTSWAAVNSGLANTSVYALTASGTNLFAGTLDSGIFRSTNNGTSWTAVNSGLPLGNYWISNCVNVLVVDDTNLFAGTSGGVFLSTNNGTNWTAVNSGLANTGVCSLVISDTNLFAGTERGVFLSTNNGKSWAAIGLANT